MLAKALERLGDRWALLVVRDLLTGPRRFTDLMDRLGGITPRTLTQRLRDLESDGLVAVDREPGRREVWYRLTAAGQDLAPVVGELTRWGLRHLAAPPAPGDAVHPEHLLSALRLVLEQETAMWIPMSTAEREEFLAGAHLGVLSAAAGQAGRTLAVPVWYSYQPGGLLTVLTGRRSRKAEAIRAAGRFGLCVQDDRPPYRYVSVEGPVVSEDEPDPAERLALARRYLGAAG